VPRNKLHPDFPLRVFVACDYCGTNMTGSFAKRQYGYYFCRNSKCKKVSVPKDRLEAAFLSLLTQVEFKPEYRRLFRTVVEDAWKARGEHSKRATELASKRLAELKDEKERLIDAVIDKRISQEIYEERLYRVDQKIALAEIALHDASVEELEIDTLLRFADRVLGDTSRLWLDSSVEQRQKLQRIVFPNGLRFSNEEGFGTPVTGPLFNSLETIRTDLSSLASQTVSTLNTLAHVIRESMPLYEVCHSILCELRPEEIQSDSPPMESTHTLNDLTKCN
jgi:site-specific DNA recombinase